MRPVVRARALTYEIGDARVLDAVDLDVYPGQAMVLVGTARDGGGTLLRLLAALQHPSSGEISIAGVDAVRSPRTARAHVLYVREDAVRGCGLTAREHLRIVAQSARAHRAIAARTIGEVLERMAIPETADIDRLNAAGRRQLAMAAVLILAPKVVLLDNLVNATDPETCRCIGEGVAELRGTGSAVVSAVRTIADGAFAPDVVMSLDRGRLSLLSGTPTDVGVPQRGRETAHSGWAF